MHTFLLYTAKYLIFVAAIAAIAYWLTLPRKQKLRLAIYVVVTGAITYALMKIGSALYYDPRPFVAHNLTPLYPHGNDNGFPSDHAGFSAALAVAVYSQSKRLGIVLGIACLMIGGARVLGHIHSPIDIAGSIVFALLGGLAASYLTPVVMKRFVGDNHENHDGPGGPTTDTPLHVR